MHLIALFIENTYFSNINGSKNGNQMKSFVKAWEICIFLDVSIHYFTFLICSEFRLYAKCNHGEYSQYQSCTSKKWGSCSTYYLIIILSFLNQQKLFLEYLFKIVSKMFITLNVELNGANFWWKVIKYVSIIDG